MANNPIALVTGVSRETGLGLEVARQLLSRGLGVVVTARTQEKAEASAALLRDGGAGDRVHAEAVDVESDASVSALVERSARKHGRLDVLVNNAGGYYDQDATPLTTEMEFAAKAFALNCLAAWRMTRAFVPLLRKSDRARVVNVSSAAGSFAGDGFFGLGAGANVVSYSVSKLALNGLTVKLAKELAPSGILVNAVCPGFTATSPGLEKYGARPVSEGAASIVWGALIPDSGPTGGFFRDGKALAW